MYVPPKMAMFGVTPFMLECMMRRGRVPMMGENLVYDERGWWPCLAWGWMRMPAVTESRLYLQPEITAEGHEAMRLYTVAVSHLCGGG